MCLDRSNITDALYPDNQASVASVTCSLLQTTAASPGAFLALISCLSPFSRVHLPHWAAQRQGGGAAACDVGRLVGGGWWDRGRVSVSVLSQCWSGQVQARDNVTDVTACSARPLSHVTASYYTFIRQERWTGLDCVCILHFIANSINSVIVMK